MARYLVTGGCGFIGSHLVDALLHAGHQVCVLDDLSTGKRSNVPNEIQVLVGDVADPNVVARAVKKVDGVFHLAAVTSSQRCREDWLGTHATNLTGCINIFDAARRLCRRPRIVYASSVAVYGDAGGAHVTETSAVRPLTAYGADKAGCELHGHAATLVHGVPTVGLRFFDVYGPRQDPMSPYSRVVAIFSGRIAANQTIAIHGDGRQVRDFIYVTDVVRFLIQAMESPDNPAGIYNVCTGRGISILDLAKMIGRLCGKEPQIAFEPARIGDIRVSLGNPDRARDELHCAAEIDLEEGLRLTLAHSREPVA